MELLKEKLMSEEVVETPVEAPAPKKGKKAAPEQPVNTIIDLGAPLIVVTKAEEPAEEVEAPISAATRAEMEAGRRIVEGYK